MVSTAGWSALSVVRASLIRLGAGQRIGDIMPAIVAGMANLMAQLDQFGIAYGMDDIVPGANIILSYAQELCPVDTGNLRDSGFTKVMSDNVLIGFDAEYASYVEFGTYKMEAQPFLRPAIDEMELDALEAIASVLEEKNKEIASRGITSTPAMGGPGSSML